MYLSVWNKQMKHQWAPMGHSLWEEGSHGFSFHQVPVGEELLSCTRATAPRSQSPHSWTAFAPYSEMANSQRLPHTMHFLLFERAM